MKVYIMKINKNERLVFKLGTYDPKQIEKFIKAWEKAWKKGECFAFLKIPRLLF
jgi:hypothetical protein